MSAPAGKLLVFQFAAWVGWDSWRSILPITWQMKRVARRLLRVHCDRPVTPTVGADGIVVPGCAKCGPWKGIDPAVCPIVIESPYGAFRLVDAKGNVARCAPETVRPLE